MPARLTWATRIERAKVRGKFTPHEHDLSTDWPTCAVGERPPLRGSLPDELIVLGVNFCWHVCENEIAEAESTYLAIQSWYAEHLKEGE